MNRQLAPLLLLGSTLLAACGGGGGSTPPPPPPAISVSFSTAPPTSLAVNDTAPIAVTVTNDSANAGVTFSCAPSGSCGTFTSITATSATYNAPAAPPSGGIVTIAATSVTDSTKNAHGSVTINGPLITVTFTSTIPASLAESATLPLVVSLTNDTTNAGVTFACSPSGSCGTFKNPTTNSATYVAPSTVPTGGTVSITATSVAQSSANATSNPINITASASNASLNGHYVFLVHSPTGNRNVATWIGSVALDGAGNVTGGVEEIASKIILGDVADAILPTGASGSLSGYTVDPSGHGRLTISTTLGEVLRMSFVLTSAAHAEVIEADGSPSQGNPGTGTLDLQTSVSGGFATSQISGTYSFTMSGSDDLTSAHLSFGGSFSSDGNSNITSASLDINNGSSPIETDTTNGSSAFDAAPDANGRGKFHFAVASPGQSRSFVYYILSPKVLRIIEADGLADMGGSAYLQPTSAPSLSGNFVYQHSGWTSTTSRTVAAGQFSLANGSISSGICDSNPGGGLTPTTAASVTGSYAVPTLTLTESAATSTFKLYPVDSSTNILDPNSAAGGGGALLLHTDSKINGTGVLLPQQTPQALSSNFAVNLMNSIAATPTELDLVGILTGGASGLADYEQKDSTGSNPMLGAALSASLAADSTHAGRYTGTLTVTPAATAVSPYSFIPGVTPPTTFSISLYQATASQAFAVENDNKANIIGRIVQENLP